MSLILPLRSPRSARNYKRIWMDEGSPLTVYTNQLRAALALELAARQAGEVLIESAYLYSTPFVGPSLRKLQEAGARRIIVLPMFPQCSGTTTGAIYDQVGVALRSWRNLPDLRLISDYHAEPGYIAALANSVREHWQKHERTQHLLLSFHGIPERCVTLGDPYERHCRKTAALLAEALGLEANAWTLSFQSRFGNARWLSPATDLILAGMPGLGIKSVTVICPGFSVDCLETLEEIAIGGQEIFMHAGGESFQYVPALNGRTDHAQALAGVLLGTPPAAPALAATARAASGRS
jgi:ferrochelatase